MSAADVVSDPIGSILGGGAKEARRSNSKNLDFIKSLFLGKGGLNEFGAQQYGKALGELDKVGPAQHALVNSRERQDVGGMNQNLASSGLWSPYMAQNASRGIHSDALRTHGLIDSQLAQMRAGLFTGQAGYQAGNINNLAGILSGVQHTGGNVTGDLAKSLASIFGSGGIFG